MFENEKGFLDWLAGRVDAKIAPAGKRKTVCIVAGNGNGDTAWAIALAAGVRAEHESAFIVLLTAYDGRMTKWDMAAWAMNAGDPLEDAPATGNRKKRLMPLDAHVATHPIPREPMLEMLRAKFDIVLDAAPIAVRAYHKTVRKGGKADYNARAAQEQADARMMGVYRMLADEYPYGDWRLRDVRELRCEIMSRTSGYIVDPKALLYACALEGSEPTDAEDVPPGHDVERLLAASGSVNEKDAELDAERYVVVANGAGALCNVKLAPPPVMDAIVDALAQLDIRCVQVGGPNDSAIPFSVDRRGLRLHLTNRIIANSLCVVANEGFIPILAAGIQVPCVTLFGPTPAAVYTLPESYPLMRGNQQPNSGGCPWGTCFWGGGGFCPTTQWSQFCWLSQVDPKANPSHPNCGNFPAPADAAKAVRDYVERIIYGPMQEEAVA